MTMATIGRRMKNFDMSYLPAGCGGAEAPVAHCEVCGLTGAPSRSFCRLSTMTSAPPGRPPSTTQLLPILRAELHVVHMNRVVRCRRCKPAADP